MSKILVFGAGGHSRVIQELIMQHGKHEIEAIVVSAILDPVTENWPAPVIAEPDLKKTTATQAVLALGNTQLRERILKDILKVRNFTFPSLVHPSAIVGQEVNLGSGCIIMAGCVVQRSVKIGDHSLIGAGSTLDYETEIGCFVNIGAGTHIGPKVKIGNLTNIDLGSTIVQNTEIGDESVVGAGSVVLKNIPANVTASGNPCRVRILEEVYT